MSEARQRIGRCLCGAVTFRAVVSPSVQACHCVQCQRWTGGGPLFSVSISDLEISGEDRVAAYHASEWGERAFCATCGSALYWKMQGRPTASVAVGVLDDQTDLAVREEIFVDYRPDWMPAWPEARQSTEAQELAKLDAFLAGEKT